MLKSSPLEIHTVEEARQEGYRPDLRLCSDDEEYLLEKMRKMQAILCRLRRSSPRHRKRFWNELRQYRFILRHSYIVVDHTDDISVLEEAGWQRFGLWVRNITRDN